MANEKSNNQKIAEWMGKHLCQPMPYPNPKMKDDGYYCGQCGNHVDTQESRILCECPPPAYDTDLNLTREAELKAIEVFGRFKYASRLLDRLTRHPSYDERPVDDEELWSHIATAPADVRCQAIVNLIEGQSARGR